MMRRTKCPTCGKDLDMDADGGHCPTHGYWSNDELEKPERGRA